MVRGCCVNWCVVSSKGNLVFGNQEAQDNPIQAPISVGGVSDKPRPAQLIGHNSKNISLQLYS